MLENIEFIKKHYINQIETLNDFIKDAYPNLPNQDSSQIRFGGGTALAIYYFQHRLSFDVDLFVQDPQIINYLSPKHWLEDSSTFGDEMYVDFVKLLKIEAITKQDINELNHALDTLDKDKYDYELEVVKPFEKYIKIAQNAPIIIQKECCKILFSE